LLSKLLLLFIVVPLLEMVIIIKVGQYIGLGYTLVSIIVLGILGALIAKQQGLRILFKIKDDLARGQLPAQELLDGLLVLIGSVLLITPGLVTDAVAFFFLLPSTRSLIKLFLRKKLEKMLKTGQIKLYFK